MPPDAGRGKNTSEAVLILGCRNEACRKAGPIDAQHDDYGWREWTAEFEHDALGYIPKDPAALRCPDCGQGGIVYAY